MLSVPYRVRFAFRSRLPQFLQLLSLVSVGILGFIYLKSHNASKADCPNAGASESASGVVHDEDGYTEPFDPWRFKGHGFGRPFPQNLSSFLKELNLDDESIDKIDDRRVLSVDLPAFATAVSDNHLSEVQQLIYCVEKYFPGHKLYVYDIGLNHENRLKLGRCSTLEIRDFDFDLFPDYVRYLREYRWKLLIVATLLKTEAAVWWLDATVKIKTSDISEMLNRVGVISPDDPESIISPEKVHPVQLLSKSFHGYYSTTDFRILEYFPTDLEVLKDITQFDGSIFLVYGTQWAKRHWLRWLVLCSVEKDCMAPEGTDRGRRAPCYFGGQNGEYYNLHSYCHRYDQTVMNLVLMHYYNFRAGLFSSDVKSIVENNGTKLYNYVCYENGA